MKKIIDLITEFAMLICLGFTIADITDMKVNLISVSLLVLCVLCTAVTGIAIFYTLAYSKIKEVKKDDKD